MLDYNTIEVINSNIGMFPPSKTFIVWIVIVAILIVFSATVYFGSSGAILGLVFAVVFSLVSFYCGNRLGLFDNLAIIRIEVKDAQMTSSVYPSENFQAYLRKEGDKVYYYDMVSAKILGNAEMIKQTVEGKFQELVLNLKDGEPQEGK